MTVRDVGSLPGLNVLDVLTPVPVQGGGSHKRDTPVAPLVAPSRTSSCTSRAAAETLFLPSSSPSRSLHRHNAAVACVMSAVKMIQSVSHVKRPDGGFTVRIFQSSLSLSIVRGTTRGYTSWHVGGGVRIHPENARMSGRHGVQYVAQCVACAALTPVVWQ